MAHILAIRRRMVYTYAMANKAPVRYTTGFTMRVDDDFLATVDELRRLSDPIPTRSDAIRMAVIDALRTARRARERQKERT
jgi:metal-responsive CopG/Arc/MetJ family transcriptional regulator